MGGGDQSERGGDQSKKRAWPIQKGVTIREIKGGDQSEMGVTNQKKQEVEISRYELVVRNYLDKSKVTIQIFNLHPVNPNWDLAENFECQWWICYQL